MTLAEKHVVARFKTYLLIANGDPEEALRLMGRFSPKDRREHSDLLRKLVNKAAE